jgi:hypothetical protein
MAEHVLEDRRKGPQSRRMACEDRRNAERLAGDIAPRRNPDMPGRRRRDRSMEPA